MHELAIAEDAVALVSERAGGARVTRVVLEVGRLTAVLPDALRFGFEIAKSGTGAEEAELEIVEVAGLGRCRDCGEHIVLDRPFGRCGCGSTELDILDGEQLRIREIEVI